MKPKHSFEPHLVLKQIILAPGEEMKAQAPGWHFLQVIGGVGCWEHPRQSLELPLGSVLAFSGGVKGVIRASQLADFLIRVFRLRPDRLTGLLTWEEQRYLDCSAADQQVAARVFSSTSEVAAKFEKISKPETISGLRGRLQMLELFVEVFGNDLQTHKPRSDPPLDAKARLVKLLKEIPTFELLELSFGDLVREMRCTPRHLSRIFKQVVGMSFREKQSEARLLRARELLMTTESKVVEVALESGYQSPCLFNLLFKRRFGVTPAKWRDLSKKRNLSTRPGPPLILKSKGRALALASL